MQEEAATVQDSVSTGHFPIRGSYSLGHFPIRGSCTKILENFGRHIFDAGIFANLSSIISEAFAPDTILVVFGTHHVSCASRPSSEECKIFQGSGSGGVNAVGEFGVSLGTGLGISLGGDGPSDESEGTPRN